MGDIINILAGYIILYSCHDFIVVIMDWCKSQAVKCSEGDTEETNMRFVFDLFSK